MSDNKKNVRIQAKGDTTARWESLNPSLMDREIGYDLDTGEYKIGKYRNPADTKQGTYSWKELPAYGGKAGNPTINEIDGAETSIQQINENSISIANSQAQLENNCFLAEYKNNKLCIPNIGSNSPGTYTETFTTYYIMANNNKIIYNDPSSLGAPSSIVFVLDMNNEWTYTVPSSIQYDFSEGKKYIIKLSSSVITWCEENFQSIKYFPPYSITFGRNGFSGIGAGIGKDSLVMLSSDNSLSGSSGTPAQPQAYGKGSMAFGKYTVAGSPKNVDDNTIGREAVALGYHTVAEGKRSFAAGGYGKAIGEASVALNGVTTATGTWSTALNNSTTAAGQAALSCGSYTHANGTSSFAGGDFATATGNYSFAFGGKDSTQTLASGAGSVAFGRDTQALADRSFAAGEKCIASGAGSVALGVLTKTEATGTGALATNIGTVAKGYAQTVIGKYNALNANPLFIIGNGTSDKDRKNILEIGSNSSNKATLKLGSVLITEDELKEFKNNTGGLNYEYGTTPPGTLEEGKLFFLYEA